MKNTNQELGKEIKDLLTRLKKSKLENCKVELIGKWVWVSGDTKQYAEKLKKYGMHFATKKKQWFFTTENYVRRFNTPKTTDYAKQKYGVETIKEA